MLDEGRDPQRRLEHRSEPQVGDAQVHGHPHRSVRRVDVAGDGDADRGDVLPQLELGVVDETGDLADERFAIGRDGALVVDTTTVVGDDDGYVGPTDVDARDQRAGEYRLIGRDHRANPRPSNCSMSSADAPTTTTSSWT